MAEAGQRWQYALRAAPPRRPGQLRRAWPDSRGEATAQGPWVSSAARSAMKRRTAAVQWIADFAASAQSMALHEAKDAWNLFSSCALALGDVLLRS